jgi:hypothetical protein
MRLGKVVLSSLCLLGIASSFASAEVLYDASKFTTPDQQGWTYASLGSPIITAPTVGNVYTTLNSTANSVIEAGYGINTPTPIGTGTHLTFDLQVLNEVHNGPNRAGLSVIVLGNSLNGIELDFWNNQIWAQNVGFTHGEGATFDTTGSGSGVSGLNQFDLFFSNSSYSLFANGGTTALLTGSLRNYSGFGFPYNVPDSIFVGDDTTAASSSFRLSQVTVAPEPSSLLLLLLPVVASAGKLRRHALSPCTR